MRIAFFAKSEFTPKKVTCVHSVWLLCCS